MTDSLAPVTDPGVWGALNEYVSLFDLIVSLLTFLFA